MIFVLLNFKFYNDIVILNSSSLDVISFETLMVQSALFCFIGTFYIFNFSNSYGHTVILKLPYTFRGRPRPSDVVG